MKLDDVLSRSQLPALPASAIKLLELSQDPTKGPRDFARPIEADIALMGQVLRFVNSAYFGFSRQISSVEQAISLVGIRPIKNFALWNAVFSLVPSPVFGDFEVKGLWQDSLRRAVFSRHLGKALGLTNFEELFSAALLQDMAIPVLLMAMPDEYDTLFKRTKLEGIRLSTLERESFGWDHAEAAAALCNTWRLPSDFAKLIGRHTSLDDLVSAGESQLDCACVAVAAMLPSCKCEEWDEQSSFFYSLGRVTSGASVDFGRLFKTVDSEFMEFCPLMNLPVPKKNLAMWFRDAAAALAQ